MADEQRVIGFDHLRMTDADKVGGKNASLGEMISQLGSHGVRVPGGFATTAFAFREFLEQDGLKDRIDQALTTLDVDNVTRLAKTGAEMIALLRQEGYAHVVGIDSFPDKVAFGSRRGLDCRCSSAERSSSSGGHPTRGGAVEPLRERYERGAMGPSPRQCGPGGWLAALAYARCG